MIDNAKVASILASTYANAGILDDYDEVLGDAMDMSIEDGTGYHGLVMEGARFIREYGEPKECGFNDVAAIDGFISDLQAEFEDQRHEALKDRA